MANIDVKVYEDNAGGIHVVVRTDGSITNFFSGMEYEYTKENKLTGIDLIEAAKGGFEYADDYNPDDFDGIPLEKIAAEVEEEPTTNLIAEITENEVKLYFDDMGAEGHYLFGYAQEEEK